MSKRSRRLPRCYSMLLLVFSRYSINILTVMWDPSFWLIFCIIYIICQSKCTPQCCSCLWEVTHWEFHDLPVINTLHLKQPKWTVIYYTGNDTWNTPTFRCTQCSTSYATYWGKHRWSNRKPSRWPPFNCILLSFDKLKNIERIIANLHLEELVLPCLSSLSPFL